MAASSRRVAFLRGINVGRAKRIAMADLRALLESLGHTEVRTHLNSGNVVFTAAPRSGTDEVLARTISAAIADEFGFDVAVVVRTRAELAAVVARDPLGAVATDPSRYLVVFLSAAPSKSAAAALDPEALAPEQFELHGRELYAWMPTGVSDSRLPKVYDQWGLVATGRNWKTVGRVLELLDE